MSLTNIILGHAVSGISLYAGFGCATKSRLLCVGLARLHPVAGYGIQVNIGILVALFVGALLSKVRLLLDLVPEGADPAFPGTMLGVSLFVWVAGLLAAHILFAAIINRVGATKAPSPKNY